ncbi:MAG: ABC transporter substrate-binding protein [Acidobacteria bacterium]|nr:ABC transporter substrate-binding protein [Acidobacteriota bacterium]
MKRHHAVLLAAVVSIGLVAGACSRSGSDSANSSSNGAASAVDAKCKGASLESTEIGVTDKEITVEVMADTGSPLAPGLFQGNVDAMNAYAKWVNANGGVGCRQLKVIAWDSKLSPEESKNGIINACQNALAMVGGNALFNPDVSVLGNCVDKAGQPAGLPDFVALANDINEQCAPNAWVIQAVAETCSPDGKPVTGPRDLKSYVGFLKYLQSQQADLKGIWLVPGDLPTTVQSATYQVEANRRVGIDIVGAFKTSGSLQQAGFTPFVQALKDSSANYVYNGSNDANMIKMRKETAAQGYDGVKVWACSLACYTEKFKAEGATVDNTYVWTQFIPFEEADTNASLKAYIDSVGKPDSFGMQAWQAGMLFKETIDRIVAADGPNAITRTSVISTMKTISDFTAGGTMGPKSAKGFSDCMVVLKIKDGKFTRQTGKPGEFTCEPQNVITISNYDPAAEASKIR